MVHSSSTPTHIHSVVGPASGKRLCRSRSRTWITMRTGLRKPEAGRPVRLKGTGLALTSQNVRMKHFFPSTSWSAACARLELAMFARQAHAFLTRAEWTKLLRRRIYNGGYNPHPLPSVGASSSHHGRLVLRDIFSITGPIAVSHAHLCLNL
jgi:hypothetical protein